MGYSKYQPGMNQTLTRTEAQGLGEAARPLSEILSHTAKDHTAHYHQRNAEMCKPCARGEHWRRTSLRCPCPKCNPVI